jgi:hypothetical protein
MTMLIAGTPAGSIGGLGVGHFLHDMRMKIVGAGEDISSEE